MASTALEQASPAAPSSEGRRRGVLVTTIVASLIALAFYVGFIVMMVLRARHG